MENQQTPVVPVHVLSPAPRYTIPSHMGAPYVPYVPYKSSYQMPSTIKDVKVE